MEGMSVARRWWQMSGLRTELWCAAVGDWMVVSSVKARSRRPTMERADSVARQRRWAIGTVCSVLASMATVERRRRPAEKEAAAAMAMGV
jgi:hypothetical protein